MLDCASVHIWPPSPLGCLGQRLSSTSKKQKDQDDRPKPCHRFLREPEILPPPHAPSSGPNPAPYRILLAAEAPSPAVGATVPILTVPNLTVPIITVPILTVPVLTVPIFTAPILTAPILTES